MTARKSPLDGESNIRDVMEPERLNGAFKTLLRCCTDHGGAADPEAAERGRLLRAMRVLGEFDAPLIALVSLATPAVAGRLIGELVAAGILSAIGGAADAPRYRLSIGENDRA